MWTGEGSDCKKTDRKTAFWKQTSLLNISRLQSIYTYWGSGPWTGIICDCHVWTVSVNVVCTNVGQVHSHFSLHEIQNITSRLFSCEQWVSSTTEALIAESHREVSSSLKSRFHFSKDASSSPGQPCPHKEYSGKSFRILNQNQER